MEPKIITDEDIQQLKLFQEKLNEILKTLIEIRDLREKLGL